MKRGDLVHIPKDTIFISPEGGCFNVTKRPIKAIFWGESPDSLFNSMIYYDNSFHYVKKKFIYPITQEG